MKDKNMERRLQQALNAELSGLRTSPWQREQFFENATGGKQMKKTWTMGLIIALILILMTATALAAALLTPKEIVEQIAVPTAQNNGQENYSYEELEELIRALNENGITLDEGSTLMQAFNAGHGYWERDVIDAICDAAFGRDQPWTPEQNHWYGEMMVAIGAWEENVFPLPGEGDLTEEEARALAAGLLKDAYGVDLPAESDETWIVGDQFSLEWDAETNADQTRWNVWYIYRGSGSTYYIADFDSVGQNAHTSRLNALERIDTRTVALTMDDLEARDGSCVQWSVETWAEFGDLIRDITPNSRNEWLYQHAGYRLPPENALNPERALEIAREATGVKDSRVQDNVICCADGERPIYKVCQRVSSDPADAGKGGMYDAVWCVELDCVTGEVLDKREYAYGPDSDPMMMYVPFSLLNEAPYISPDPEEIAKLAAAQERSKKEAKATEQYGGLIYFWPMAVQEAVYGDIAAAPTQAEYDRALEIAQSAVAEQYGPDALDSLGDCRIGVIHRVLEDWEYGGTQHNWDFLFTTDPEYVSDGYRVQFILRWIPLCDEEETMEESADTPELDGVEENVEYVEELFDLLVEHANLSNG